MKFGITPLGTVEEAFAWAHNTREDAEAAAQYLSDKYHIEVIVFEIIGSFVNKTVWVGVNK